jgi:PKD repeat protein
VFNDGNRSYSWHFDGGIPAHSTAINPSVFYPLPGDYEVKLVVGNSAGKDSVTTSNLVHVNGSCQANEQFQLLSVNGTDKGPCRAEQQPSLVIYNRGIKDINSFQLTILKNEDIHLDESVATFIASGDSLVYPLDELDMEGVWKIEYIISSPNGNSDDEADNVIVSYISNESIEIQNISVVSFNSATSSNTPDNAVDGDENTYWHNQYWGAEEEFPYEMIFDLNGTYDLSSLNMLNRQNNSNGYLKGVDIYTSENGNIWKGPFSTDFTETSDWQTAYFGGMEGTRFVKLVVNSSISGAKVASIAEIKFSGCTSLITQVVGGSLVENLGVYPNPAQNYLQIKGFEEGMSYQLMNANGLLVEQGASAQLNIENLPKGTYFLTLKNKDVVWVKKWIKL